MQDLQSAGGSKAQLLTLQQWLTMRSSEIRSAGHDPRTRLRLLGHELFVDDVWARSVGHWCKGDTTDFCTEDGSGILLFTARATYFQFKKRWRLRTRRQFNLRWIDRPWSVATQCLAEYIKIQSSLGNCAPMGVAARMTAPVVGVLPVEVVLYVKQMAQGFEALDLSAKEWLHMGVEERDNYWWGTPDDIEEIFCTELHGSVPAEDRVPGL